MTSDRFAARLRGFGPLGILAIIYWDLESDVAHLIFK